MADYRAFLALAAAHARPTSDAELQADLDALAGGTVPWVAAPTDSAALGQIILDALNIRFLRDGIDERPLRVITTGRRENADSLERDLLFEDPYVGTFQGILLVPRTGGLHPAIVAIHGHGDDAAIYRDDYHGGEWPARGYAILMLTMRVMNIDDDEHRLSHDLLVNGFTLIGLRDYETLLGLKYLRSRPEVDPDRIGLIGHSGGSSAGNLTVRFEPGFKAFVSDNVVDWYSSDPDEPYHCETVPTLYPYHALINQLDSAETPTRQVLYGYVLGMREIFAFFDANL